MSKCESISEEDPSKDFEGKGGDQYGKGNRFPRSILPSLNVPVQLGDPLQNACTKNQSKGLVPYGYAIRSLLYCCKDDLLLCHLQGLGSATFLTTRTLWWIVRDQRIIAVLAVPRVLQTLAEPPCSRLTPWMYKWMRLSACLYACLHHAFVLL